MVKKFNIKDQLAGIAALIAAIVAIGGGFVKYGEITTRLDSLAKVKDHASTNTTNINTNSKNSEINAKEIELLQLQIREIQAKSGNPLSN